MREKAVDGGQVDWSELPAVPACRARCTDTIMLMSASCAIEKRRALLANALSRDLPASEFIDALAAAFASSGMAIGGTGAAHGTQAMRQAARSIIDRCRTVYWLEAVAPDCIAEAKRRIDSAESDADLATALRAPMEQHLVAIKAYLDAKAAGPALGPP